MEQSHASVPWPIEHVPLTVCHCASPAAIAEPPPSDNEAAPPPPPLPSGRVSLQFNIAAGTSLEDGEVQFRFRADPDEDDDEVNQPPTGQLYSVHANSWHAMTIPCLRACLYVVAADLFHPLQL